MIRRARAATVFAVVVAGCARRAPPDSEALAVASRSVDVPATADAAASGESALVAPRTTSPEIALGNLDVQIAQREGAARRDPKDADAAKGLVDLLLARADLASRLADYDHAGAVADALVAKLPGNGTAHLARAATRGAMHDFEAARKDLDFAATSGANPAAVRAARATIAMAEGRYDDAEEGGAFQNVEILAPTELTSAAVLAGERDDAVKAEQLFERARATFRDVSPFTLAWMDFQRGALLERRGSPSRAKPYFAEAHAALPGFAHAAVHLAALEPPAAALALLEPLVGHTDDPEVDASYGDALRRVGRTVESRAAIDRAHARYEALLALHPAAFADHAASFYLGPGHDVPRALALSRANAKVRKTEAAESLWLTAALAAGARDEACVAAKDAASLKYVTPEFRAMRDADDLRCAR